MNVFVRYPDDPDATYYARFSAPDPDRPGQSRRYLRNTFETTKEQALKALKKMVAAACAGRFEVLDLSKARHARQVTLGEIFGHYLAGARELTPRTLAGNKSSMKI